MSILLRGAFIMVPPLVLGGVLLDASERRG